MKEFVLELKELNDVEVEISEIVGDKVFTNTKQLFLNEFEIAFARHVSVFEKAYAIGKQFAKKRTYCLEHRHCFDFADF